MGQLVRPEPADGPFEIPTLEDSIAGTVRFLQWVVRMVAGGQLEPNTGRSPTYACTALLTGLKVRNMERKLEELQELLRQSGIQPPKVG